MNPRTTELKKEIQKSLELMRTLRDEVRVNLHLAGMAARDEWREIEPRLADIERAASDFSETTRSALSDMVKRLSKLRSSLN
jgi:hypothetical protein